MNSTQNSYTWTVNELDDMTHAHNTDVFKSNPFRIHNVDFVIELYPNGDTPECNGCFIVLLQPMLIPPLWHKIRYCRRIKCQETECSNTAIAHIIMDDTSLPRPTGWDDATMSFNEFKQICAKYNKITFTITICVLQVSLPNDHILHGFPSNINLPKQQRLSWNIDNHLLNKFTSAHVAQVFESEIFNNMWCIKCSFSDDKATAINVYLQLCSLPSNIDTINTAYTFTCIELNASQKEMDIFSFDYQNSGPKETFINIDDIKSMNTITIVVDINILQIQYKQTDIEKHGKMSMDVDQVQEVDKYKATLSDFMTCMKKHKPRYHLKTNKLQQLKKLAQQRYPQNKIVIEQENIEEYQRFGEIVRYIQMNQERPYGDILIKCGNKWLKQCQVLEIYSVTENKRNPGLIGQRGLKTKINMPAGTVIGEYFGREFLENEFDDIYSGTEEFVGINEYALSAIVDIKMRHSRLAYYTNTERFDDENMNEDVDVDEEVVKQEFNIVIDGLNMESDIKAMLIYMNDCRGNINMTKKTIADEEYQNIQLTTVYHNGWPKIYGITIKNIEANSEFLTFYGKSHVGWEQDRIRYERNQQLICRNIQQILNQHDIH